MAGLLLLLTLPLTLFVLLALIDLSLLPPKLSSSHISKN